MIVFNCASAAGSTASTVSSASTATAGSVVRLFFCFLSEVSTTPVVPRVPCAGWNVNPDDAAAIAAAQAMFAEDEAAARQAGVM